jgi:hypothetical protein
MLATRTRDLLRFLAGDLPAGQEFAGKRVTVGINGGLCRVRPTIEKDRASGRKKRRKFRIEWRGPKVILLFQTNEKGRMDKGSRPVVDVRLQGPEALIELVAIHLHRLGAAKSQLVTFLADGAPSSGQPGARVGVRATTIALFFVETTVYRLVSFIFERSLRCAPGPTCGAA